MTWRERLARWIYTPTLPIEHVDGVAFFIDIDLQLVQKENGTWLAYAANWSVGDRGDTAMEAMAALWYHIQIKGSLQHYLKE